MDQHTQKKSSILRFFPFTKGFRGKFLLAFLMVIVAVVANYMTPQVIRVTVDSVINDTPFNLPAFLVEWIESIGGREMLRQHIVICAAVSLVFAVIAGLSNYSSRMSLARACEGTVARVRDTLFAHIQRLPYAWHNSHQTGDIIQRCTQDVELIRNFVSDQLMEVVRTVLLIVVSLAMMFSLNGELSLLVCCFVPVLMVSNLVFFVITGKKFQAADESEGRLTAFVQENLTGVRVVRAFNNEAREESRLITAFANYAATSIKANRRFANLDGLAFFFINFFVVIVYWVSGGRISAGKFQIGDITAVIEYSILVMFFLMMAQLVILILPRALECCERVRLVLDHSPEITDLTDQAPAESHPAEVLSFRDVSFRFQDAEEDTLSHLDFVCRRGETTAIIGGTGSGKSTVASLILRFHDVTDGSIQLNGTDIRDMPQEYLRSHLAYVQQKAWLFSGTIAENLRYSRPDATEEELMHAADVAQAGDFIRSLPDGLNSFVAQGGTNFSGGQKQRLSIARALVKRPELYIFDDSFSALDFKTDAALRRALAAETQDAAVVIVAQRVSSIRHAHQIVVLHEGKMAGIGTHEELMETCQVYREIYESQTKEAQEA